jgi:hypothetical protein
MRPEKSFQIDTGRDSRWLNMDRYGLGSASRRTERKERRNNPSYKKSGKHAPCPNNRNNKGFQKPKPGTNKEVIKWGEYPRFPKGLKRIPKVPRKYSPKVHPESIQGRQGRRGPDGSMARAAGLPGQNPEEVIKVTFSGFCAERMRGGDEQRENLLLPVEP